MPYPTKSLPIAIIILLTSLASLCQTKDQYHQLIYNRKSLNQLIVDRIPDYGISNRDGCIVGREFILELSDIDQQKVEGLVKDVETKEVITNATVKLTRRSRKTETLLTDATGRFLLEKSSPIKELQIQYIGYRIFKIQGFSKQLF